MFSEVQSQPTAITQENPCCSSKMASESLTGACFLGVQVKQPWEITSDDQISLVSMLTNLLFFCVGKGLQHFVSASWSSSFLEQARAAWQLSHCAEARTFNCRTTLKQRGKIPHALVAAMLIKLSCSE